MTKEQEFRKQTEEAKFEAFSVMCKKVTKLEKENAELKEINEGYCRSRDRLILMGFPTFKDCKEYAEHLTKAKDHIENLLYYVKQCTCERSNYAEIENDIKEAEQFLKNEVSE